MFSTLFGLAHAAVMGGKRGNVRGKRGDVEENEEKRRRRGAEESICMNSSVYD